MKKILYFGEIKDEKREMFLDNVIFSVYIQCYLYFFFDSF